MNRPAKTIDADAPAELLARAEVRLLNVLPAAGPPRELADGYAFPLRAETAVIEQAAAFIVRERLCCPFFRFALEVEPGGGPTRLEITGGPGVKEYLEEAPLPRLEPRSAGD